MNLVLGDCLEKLKEIDSETVDLIYLDPPFFTQSKQTLRSSQSGKEFAFDDKWENIEEYTLFIKERLFEMYRVLKKTGSIFLHCDRNASHYLRVALDEVFGEKNFQSEIIWTYKRWSNSKNGLLNNHQNIYFYSKTSKFKFNKKFTDYSVTTNVDQILQDRVRDTNGKSKYKLDEEGNVIFGKEKKGVPLSDVWEIPYLNPKAKERVGYPTQKPILLLEQIIKLTTDEGDVILDPFAGSGTTLVAAKMLERNYIGIDLSKEALELCEKRLQNPIKTESHLLKKGKDKYQNLSQEKMNIIKYLDAVPVQRNSGIDAFLKEQFNEKPISVRIQNSNESIEESKEKLVNASKTKNVELMFLIRTNFNDDKNHEKVNIFENKKLYILDMYCLNIKDCIKSLSDNNGESILEKDISTKSIKEI